VEASHSPAHFLLKSLSFSVHRKEDVVWHVAQDFYEPFRLTELQDVIEQRILRFPETFNKTEPASEDPDLDAFNGFPHLVGSGPAPLRVLFKVFPRLH